MTDIYAEVAAELGLPRNLVKSLTHAYAYDAKGAPITKRALLAIIERNRELLKNVRRP